MLTHRFPAVRPARRTANCPSCAAARSDFAKAEPVMQAYAKAIVHAGPAGAGQLTKMVNQICIAGVVQGLSEGLHFAKRAGLDPETVIARFPKARLKAGRWKIAGAR
jgi:3-hydroxyisobutyrate dehydrogenase-like beta-hydroxyacid dehydrogenase